MKRSSYQREIAIARRCFRSRRSLLEVPDKSRVQFAGNELFVINDLPEEGKRSLYAANLIFIQGSPQSIDSLGTSASPCCQLRDHRVVVDRHFGTRAHAGIVADSRT